MTKVKTPTDLNQRAKSIVDLATGESETPSRKKPSSQNKSTVAKKSDRIRKKK